MSSEKCGGAGRLYKYNTPGALWSFGAYRVRKNHPAPHVTSEVSFHLGKQLFRIKGTRAGTGELSPRAWEVDISVTSSTNRYTA